MNQGWIKVYRALLDNPITKKPKHNHLWIILLLKAAHSYSEFIWNNTKRTLKPGQILTGRKQLSDESGLSESTIERILAFLKSERMIEQQTFTKFRIITIVSWASYQTAEQKTEQQTDNRRTATGQQADTYKKIKNSKNIHTSEFERFWNTYPKQINKAAAMKSWQQIDLKQIPPEIIIEAINRQKTFYGAKWIKEKQRYCPDASTWLKNERWQDKIEVKKHNEIQKPLCRCGCGRPGTICLEGEHWRSDCWKKKHPLQVVKTDGSGGRIYKTI